jgi:hypothetical protein
MGEETTTTVEETVTSAVGFDYSTDLEEIKTTLDVTNQGLFEVHSDLSRIFYILILGLIVCVLWKAIFDHFGS